jgi:AdoMet-dependent heme synthase
MRIKHPGNFQSIESPRCAMDAMKYSRNKRNLTSNLPVDFREVPDNAFLEIEGNMHEIDLGEDSTLFISNNPHSWFITDHSFGQVIDNLKRGRRNSQEIDQHALAILYEKGLLRINGSSLNIGELSGRYSVCSDNVALISITDRCNLNCEHCVANANKNRLLDTELTLEELTRVFKHISGEINPYGLDVEKKVFISGGEPLVRRDLCDTALACANEGLSTHICTNGLKITSNLLDKLRGTNIAFSVSLDGDKYNHELVRGSETFEPTIQKIKEIHNAGFDLFLNTFLHEGNIGDMEYLLNFGVETGVLGINFIRAIPRGRGKDMKFKRVPDKILFKRLYDFMKKDKRFYSILENENTFPILATSAIAGVKSLNCGLSRGNYFFLDSIGNVYPCPGTRHEEFLVGNIRKLDFSEIFQKRREHPLADLRVDTFPYCSSCEYMYLCGGDCRGSAYGNSVPKDIKSPVPYCSERIESLKEMFRILGNDPEFLRAKANWIVQNAKQETNRRSQN